MRRWPARRRATLAAVTAVVALLTGWIASPWGPGESTGAAPDSVVLATGGSGGLAQQYGLALAEEAGHVAIRPKVSAGSRANLDLLRRGEAEFALATADVVEDYLAPEEYLAPEPGRASIRAVAQLYDSYLHLVVRTNAPVHRLADLRGRPVAVGTLGSGTALAAGRLLTAAGIDPTIDITRFELGGAAAIAALYDQTIDAFFYMDGPGSPDLTMEGEVRPARLIDLADVAGMLPAAPTCPAACAVYHVGTLPADTYPGLAVSVTTVAVPTLLLTTDAVGDDVVRHVTGLIFDSAPAIAPAVHAVGQIDRHAAIFTGPVPLHDGARAYYRATKDFA